MIVRAAKWRNEEAISIVHEKCSLVITTSIGPRIISLTYKSSENLLYEDETGFGVEDWKLMGGHRFTTAPEDAASYYPDNAPCKAEYEQAVVRITAPMRPDRLQLAIEIQGADKGKGFIITHLLHNHGQTTWHGALWAITCIPRFYNAVASCTTKEIKYWPDTEPANWTVTDGVMSINPGDFRGKTGWHEKEGWLGASCNGTSLTIAHRERTSPADCADNGCNLEMFACSNWIELETLGKLETLGPGECAKHQQEWILSSDEN